MLQSNECNMCGVWAIVLKDVTPFKEPCIVPRCHIRVSKRQRATEDHVCVQARFQLDFGVFIARLNPMFKLHIGI